MRKLKLDELNRLNLKEFKELEKYPVHIVLDNIRSGVNVGSFFRTADAFALEHIHLCGYTPKPPHAEIFKTAIGSTKTVNWTHTPDVHDSIHQLKKAGCYCIGIEQTDQSILLHQVTHLQTPIALVFGNEVNGLTEGILPLLDEVWEVPQFGTKHSLNVSVCGGIVLWEVIRSLIR
ncbi:TrmH family RNA methyltransferase [Membranicola marinus]|uniref:TrmH family RNA methyltransferase n=1 Tax=Membranihabitans marinus TaxID=1227546 RepID=A0A953L7Z3_9BACT|nr:TrmH family RNA methyltransferase [Membranihabitans marinus]MBY5957135.1 TrmH family RNA methyltransferase [Membranihabitans marinus]